MPGILVELDGTTIQLEIEQDLTLQADIGTALEEQSSVAYRYGHILNRIRNSYKRVKSNDYAKWRANALYWAKWLLRAEGDPKPSDKSAEAVLFRLYDKASMGREIQRQIFAAKICEIRYEVSGKEEVERTISELYPPGCKSYPEWINILLDWELTVADLELAKKCLEDRSTMLVNLNKLVLAGYRDIGVAARRHDARLQEAYVSGSDRINSYINAKRGG